MARCLTESERADRLDHALDVRQSDMRVMVLVAVGEVHVKLGSRDSAPIDWPHLELVAFDWELTQLLAKMVEIETGIQQRT